MITTFHLLLKKIYTVNLPIQSEYKKIRTKKKRIWILFTQRALPFLDVLICRKCSSIVTTLFWKPTNNEIIYLNWNTFASVTWKGGTLKTLLERAYIVCSTNELIQKELKYLEKFSMKLISTLSTQSNKS